jgi:hypothetical protein
LAGTFPAPLFLVPEKIADELRTWGIADLTTLVFSNVQDLVDSVDLVVHTMSQNKPIGNYIPQTIVIDSVTEIQNMLEHEILNHRWKDVAKTSSGDTDQFSFPTMTNRDWGVVYNVLMTMRNNLYNIPNVHVIWIGHAKIQIKTEQGSKSREFKTVSLRGDAKNFIPNSCNVLSYLEALSAGGDKYHYYLHGRPYNGWNSRIHFPSGQSGFSRIGGTYDPTHPNDSPLTYETLAPYFGLPTRDECETGMDFGELEEEEVQVRRIAKPIKQPQRPNPRPQKPTQRRKVTK